MLAGQEIIEQLVRGRALVPRDRATYIAGQHANGLAELVLDPAVESLVHERGWVWAVYFTQGKARTHFVLIHADGTTLARAVAEEIIAADATCKGRLRTLVCVNPVPPAPALDPDGDPRVANALAAYRHYLTQECGFLQTDGLPCR